MTTPERLEFRQATEADSPRIWPVFQRVIASGDTFVFDPAITEADARSAWLYCNDERRRTYVAETGGRVVGTAILRPTQPGLGDHIANAGWMIAPESTGLGIGRRFAQFVMDEARALGFTGMQFNAVVATNVRAIALWESLGFRIAGTIPNAFRHAALGPTAIHIMYRAL